MNIQDSAVVSPNFQKKKIEVIDQSNSTVNLLGTSPLATGKPIEESKYEEESKHQNVFSVGHSKK